MLDDRQEYSFALIGFPNVGKTTLFNSLTGRQEPVGNWAGVTVTCLQAKLDPKIAKARITDLPGCYSLCGNGLPTDMQATLDYIYKHPDDIYLNVIDSSKLQRDLTLTLQLLELGIKVIIVVNNTTNNVCLNISNLLVKLACELVVVDNNCAPKEAIKLIKQVVAQQKQITNNYIPTYPLDYQNSINIKQQQLAKIGTNKLSSVGLAINLLSGNQQWESQLYAGSSYPCKQEPLYVEDADVMFANHRHQIILDILPAETTVVNKTSVQEKIDKVLMHPLLGAPCFLLIMYLVFIVSMGVGGLLQPCCEIISTGILVDGLLYLGNKINMPVQVTNLLALGVGQGIAITLTFAPVLLSLFFSLGFLERSGYLSRAAFIVDRGMAYLGLSGQAFVPLIVGFGCNVPAIMGARTLQSKRERILLIMMSPFLSCSARLAIYSVFVSCFFPTNRHHVIFSLYLIGIAIAMLTAKILNSWVLPTSANHCIIEFPDYCWPSFSGLWRQAKYKVTRFVQKTSLVVVPLCVLINGIGHNNLVTIGKTIAPVFKPFGVTEQNWPAAAGLVTGMVAKETVVATLATLYQNNYQDQQVPLNWSFSLIIKNAIDSIYQQALSLTDKLLPWHWLQPTDNQSTNGFINNFGSWKEAYAYLLFTLLYFPCISVVGAISRELDWLWAFFAVIWSNGLAYLLAAGFYQAVTSWQWHVLLPPVISLILLLLWLRRQIAKQPQYVGNKIPTVVTILG